MCATCQKEEKAQAPHRGSSREGTQHSSGADGKERWAGFQHFRHTGDDGRKDSLADISVNDVRN